MKGPLRSPGSDCQFERRQRSVLADGLCRHLIHGFAENRPRIRILFRSGQEHRGRTAVIGGGRGIGAVGLRRSRYC